MPGYGIAGPSEGTGLLPWAWATDRLIHSRNYWLATVWPDHRPHVTPVWGVWRDEMLWFSCGPRSRKARNIAANPAAVATTEDAVSPVVVAGDAEVVDDRDTVVAFAQWADAKYATSYGAEFYTANACFRIRITSVFGLSGDDFTGSPTRWAF
jgi:Pyridoxamine 5'-phosphate oxidase